MSIIDDADEPTHPAQVIHDNREVFETIVDEVDDDEVAEAFGQAPLNYLKEHREEVDDGDA